MMIGFPAASWLIVMSFIEPKVLNIPISSPTLEPVTIPLERLGSKTNPSGTSTLIVPVKLSPSFRPSFGIPIPTIYVWLGSKLLL